MKLGKICRERVTEKPNTTLPNDAVFQVTRRGCAATSEAGALPASSSAIYKPAKTGLLLKPSQSSQSAKTPHSQPGSPPSLQPITEALAVIEPWQQQAQSTTAQKKSNPGYSVCSFLTPKKMKLQLFVIYLIFLCISCGASALATSIPTGSTSLPAANFTNLGAAHSYGTDTTTISKSRRKRYISQNDMLAILDYHNKVRGKVFPPASNMEYMVWDDTLAKTAEDWAHACLWEHGPPHLLRFLGQNLSVRTGRYRSILQLVKPWYDEVKDYSFPYPRDCNPRCPLRCYGPMCTHYTQMVWATSNKVGCAVHTCHNMNVWGSVWKRATYLVCNYSPKGNWIGEAPYKVGVPCSACPPSYGGSCSNNMCFPALKTNYLHWFK
ncbi:peptidase inhibitor 15-A [Trachinotus anak]|uniref:peptidase inhibitor 15-A n=1 Tax=Trachinotus anak TaxID=443729 RepID=UPI0039F196C3